MRTLKYIIAAAALLSLLAVGAKGENSARCRKVQMEQPAQKDTVATLNLDTVAAISTRVTDWLNSQLVLSDKQYKKLYESVFKEVIVLQTTNKHIDAQEALDEIDTKMKRFLKEYQYKLYLQIREKIYERLQAEALKQ